MLAGLSHSLATMICLSDSLIRTSYAWVLQCSLWQYCQRNASHSKKRVGPTVLRFRSKRYLEPGFFFFPRSRFGLRDHYAVGEKTGARDRETTRGSPLQHPIARPPRPRALKPNPAPTGKKAKKAASTGTSTHGPVLGPRKGYGPRKKNRDLRRMPEIGRPGHVMSGFRLGHEHPVPGADKQHARMLPP